MHIEEDIIMSMEMETEKQENRKEMGKEVTMQP